MANPDFGGSATATDDAALREALAFFRDDPSATFGAATGGVNNIVQYVDTSDGERCVLRVYNNGCDTPRVMFEHAILGAINKLGKEMSFQVPQFLPSLTTGKTTATMASGTQCCLCQLIPGSLPKDSDPKPIGRATGELLVTLGEASALVDYPCPTAPFREVYKAHAGCGEKAVFHKYVEDHSEVFSECRGGMATLLAELARLETKCEEYQRAGSLPTQLIHADLHFDNVLTDPATGKVTGLLDFEFACVDWRAMEPAVSLTKYVGAEDPMPLLQAFLEGFAEHAIFTEAECEALPDLINLRVLHNCVYFVGRAITGEDTIDALTTRAEMYATRVVWVRDNAPKITKCVSDLMQAKAKAQLQPAH